ncbi:MAG: HAD family phosphatase [Solobacterium sp.]|nr:HAD family phosphatase [Solobacterium sp.]
MKIEAVLFDCDGLMFDTEIIAQEMLRELGRNYGVEIPDAFIMAITGANLKNVEANFPELAPILEESKQYRFDLNFWKSIHTDCLNKEGLLELFAYLETNGYKVAICSSSGRDYVETVMGTTSIPLHYDAIVCGDMVKEVKPNPEIFLTASALLKVKPENCLVLEDSKNGILAARNAGMHNCFIEDTIGKDEEMAQNIEFECANLREVIALLERVS